MLLLPKYYKITLSGEMCFQVCLSFCVTGLAMQGLNARLDDCIEATTMAVAKD